MSDASETNVLSVTRPGELRLTEDLDLAVGLCQTSNRSPWRAYEQFWDHFRVVDELHFQWSWLW